MKKIFSIFLMLAAFSLGFSQAPTVAAPTPPARNAADVISIYSDAYTNIAGVNTNPNWGQTGFATASVISVGGVNTLSYPNFNYQGVDFNGSQNVSGMEYLHVDVWSNDTNPNVYVISSGPEVAHSLGATAGVWTSVDLPISGLTGDPTNAIQFKFDGGTGGTIYLENLYFWKAAANPTTDATLSDLKVDGTSITAFSAATTTYTYNVVVGTTTVPQITAATTTQSGATTVITQATSIPGSATVVVTAADGTTMKTYTVNIAATIPPASPTPSTTGMLLPINFNTGATVNDTGTPSTATAFNPEYNFGSYTNIKNLGTAASPNNAIFTNLSAGYGAGVQPTAPVDVSGYGYLNFDYFVPANETPGANGDEFYFDLISANPTKENNYEIMPSGGDAVLVKGSWQTVSVPLATFVGKGFNPTQFFQFKIGATSDINTSAVYFDNIYFSTVPATLGVRDIQNNENKLQVYPNPVNSGSNIMITGKVKSVQVYNMNGQLVKTSATQSVSSQGLTKGVYLIKATDNSGSVQTTKVIVK